ncbi:ricin B lectin domain-containing protein [Phanerochaete sordida]|uniref:Ricin B lectin domain-containing protein n=1 Tax=Phanerochaete sordida TaxID=48140 RepID=A0A9P3G4X9_9APHY|nr:ricin B lectin domain-containing protein [Phanerochaete sordida]
MASEKVQDGVYFIQNIGTGEVMDLLNASNAKDTTVQGFVKREPTDTWVPAQLWVISERSDHYRIESAVRSHLELSSATGDVVCNAETNNSNQKWKIYRNSNKTAYVIQNVDTGTYASLGSGSVTNYPKIVGASGSGAATTDSKQLWLIVRV